MILTCVFWNRTLVFLKSSFLSKSISCCLLTVSSLLPQLWVPAQPPPSVSSQCADAAVSAVSVTSESLFALVYDYSHSWDLEQTRVIFFSCATFCFPVMLCLLRFPCTYTNSPLNSSIICVSSWDIPMYRSCRRHLAVRGHLGASHAPPAPRVALGLWRAAVAGPAVTSVPVSLCLSPTSGLSCPVSPSFSWFRPLLGGNLRKDKEAVCSLRNHMLILHFTYELECDLAAHSSHHCCWEIWSRLWFPIRGTWRSFFSEALWGHVCVPVLWNLHHVLHPGSVLFSVLGPQCVLSVR